MYRFLLTTNEYFYRKFQMDERHYKIWVVKYYSDFFKVCYPKLNFLYGDLLQPGKQSSHHFLFSRLFLIVCLFIRFEESLRDT